MNKPVCLFDSGIGGLTVLKKLLENFPSENYIYLADLARVPFGDKSNDEITNIANEIIEWLSKFNPKLIIMACNTSSTVLGSHLSSLTSHLPIYGMIESCAKEIANSDFSHITTWATKLVVKNNGYKNAIKKHNSNITVQEIACPKLVPMIEDLNFNLEDRYTILKEYLNQISNDSQALILGCTHYPLLTEDLKKLTNLRLIDPTDSLINELKKELGLNNGASPKSDVSLYTTAQLEKIEKFAKLYLCKEIKVNQINLQKPAMISF